jgi:hypothetical protein
VAVILSRGFSFFSFRSFLAMFGLHTSKGHGSPRPRVITH